MTIVTLICTPFLYQIGLQSIWLTKQSIATGFVLNDSSFGGNFLVNSNIGLAAYKVNFFKVSFQQTRDDLTKYLQL